MRERDSGWDSIFKLHQKHGKKREALHKSAGIHNVRLRFNWSTNNLGLLFSCCTKESNFSKKAYQRLDGKPTVAKARWSSERNDEGHAAVDRCAHWRGGGQLRKHWAVFLFRETANLRTNEGVSLCLCVFVNSYWPGCLRVPLLVVVHIVKCRNFLNIETRETCISSLKLPAVTMRWSWKVFERSTATLCGSEGLVVGRKAHRNELP